MYRRCGIVDIDGLFDEVKIRQSPRGFSTGYRHCFSRRTAGWFGSVLGRLSGDDAIVIMCQPHAIHHERSPGLFLRYLRCSGCWFSSRDDRRRGTISYLVPHNICPLGCPKRLEKAGLGRTGLLRRMRCDISSWLCHEHVISIKASHANLFVAPHGDELIHQPFPCISTIDTTLSFALMRDPSA